MATIAPEATTPLVLSLRRGLDPDDLENPAGPVFSDLYREHDITMTGAGSTQNPLTSPVTRRTPGATADPGSGCAPPTCWPQVPAH